MICVFIHDEVEVDQWSESKCSNEKKSSVREEKIIQNTVTHYNSEFNINKFWEKKERERETFPSH